MGNIYILNRYTYWYAKIAIILGFLITKLWAHIHSSSRFLSIQGRGQGCAGPLLARQWTGPQPCGRATRCRLWTVPKSRCPFEKYEDRAANYPEADMVRERESGPCAMMRSSGSRALRCHPSDMTAIRSPHENGISSVCRTSVHDSMSLSAFRWWARVDQWLMHELHMWVNCTRRQPPAVRPARF
jgi:hypothetical protein